MNLIVPTAMASLHWDPILAANTAIVAERTNKIICSLKGSINIVRNCDAIIAASSGKQKHGADEELVTVGSRALFHVCLAQLTSGI